MTDSLIPEPPDSGRPSPDDPGTRSVAPIRLVPRPPGSAPAEIPGVALGGNPLSAPELPWSNWDAKELFANKLIASGFCPPNVKTPAQVIAIMLTGQELGIPPMQALRQINVISGKPTMSAELMLAKMLKGNVKLTWNRSDAKVATLTAARATTKFTGTFTIEEAIAAGLTTKDGWKKYPAAMLRARVISLVARVVAPDLISGMYIPEEMGADVTADGTIVAVRTGVGDTPIALPGERPTVIDAPGAQLGAADLIGMFQAAMNAEAVAEVRRIAKTTALGADDALLVTEAWLAAKQRTSPAPSDL